MRPDACWTVSPRLVEPSSVGRDTTRWTSNATSAHRQLDDAAARMHQGIHCIALGSCRGMWGTRSPAEVAGNDRADCRGMGVDAPAGRYSWAAHGVTEMAESAIDGPDPAPDDPAPVALWPDSDCLGVDVDASHPRQTSHRGRGGNHPPHRAHRRRRKRQRRRRCRHHRDPGHDRSRDRLARRGRPVLRLLRRVLFRDEPCGREPVGPAVARHPVRAVRWRISASGP